MRSRRSTTTSTSSTPARRRRLRSPCACAKRSRARWPAPMHCAKRSPRTAMRACASSARRASGAASRRRRRSSDAMRSAARRPTPCAMRSTQAPSTLSCRRRSTMRRIGAMAATGCSPNASLASACPTRLSRSSRARRCDAWVARDSGRGVKGASCVADLRRGAGAYICGEESAMIESIEGKRGMPRLRPPYVAQVGLFGRPTLEHNMETLYWVRDILERGAAWFAGHGRRGRKGLRSFSVSGRVAKPGVHLAPAGISVRELIDEHCGGMLPGHELYAYLPGGASGGILPASLADVPLDFDTLQPYGCFIGSAAVVVLSQHDRARDAALNLMEFFAEESCGQCTPCRVGTAKAAGLMAKPRWDLALLDDLSQAMADASICGLGQAAPNPIACVVKYFPHELK